MADTSFFFTNFPDHFFERDLWKFFQRWGRVLDVFISRKLNARNQRFGFVRFHGVADFFCLERELDTIWIGMWKLQVNLPKYRRSEVTRKDWNAKSRPVRVRNVWKPKEQQKKVSYGHVVVSGEFANCSHESARATSFNVQVESTSWLEGCFIGCIREVSCMQSIKESFIMGGFSLVRLRYLGERSILLSCDDEGVLERLIAENKAWFDGLFSSVVPWDGSFLVKERFAWVRCRGIPLQLWCSQSFVSINALVGEVVQIDDVTLEKEVLEFSRFQVKLPVASSVRLEKDICINGISCKVLLEEEERVPNLEYKRFYAKWNGGFSEVDTEAGSEEGEVGGSFCDSVAFDFGEAIGGGVGEGETVQGKVCSSTLGATVQMQVVAEVQESLRGAVKVVGSIENISYHQPGRIEGLVENGAKFIEGVAHSLEAWHAVECGFKGVVEDLLVLNKEREEVQGVFEEQVVGVNNSFMSVGVGSGLVGRAEVAHGSLSINEETTSHLPNIKEVHAKSCHAFKVGSSNSRMKENEELLLLVVFWATWEAWAGRSTQVCGRQQKTKMQVHGAFLVVEAWP